MIPDLYHIFLKTVILFSWRKVTPRRGKAQREGNTNDIPGTRKDETSALLIGAITHVPTSDSVTVARKRYKLYGVNVPHRNGTTDSNVNGQTVLSGHPVESAAVSAQMTHACEKMTPIVLDHHIFDSRNGWRKSESMAHPTLRLRLTTEAADYERVGAAHPQIVPSFVTAVTDTGALSCLWSLTDFYRCGFKDSDLLPVKRTMLAANREEIKICGAIFVRLFGVDSLGETHTAPIMAYVSPNTQKFYLSREALIQLRVIPKNFPRVGAVTETSSIENKKAECGCPLRELPPGRPARLPFPYMSPLLSQ